MRLIESSDHVRAISYMQMCIVLCLIIIGAIVTPNEIQAKSNEYSELNRHVIVGIDVSGSMRKMLKRKSARRDLDSYIYQILYDRIPTTVGQTSNLDSKIIDYKTLDYDRPLYRQGNILTVFAFGEDVDYKSQRQKSYVTKNSLQSKMPSYPKGFRADYTFMEAAKVSAYENFRPEIDGEAFFLLITDKGKDPPPGTRSEYINYISNRLNSYERQYHLLPCYSLRVRGKIWIEIFKIQTLNTSKLQPPPGDSFWLVSDTDPVERLKGLTFRFSEGSNLATLDGASFIMPNPEFKQKLELVKLTYSIMNVHADNPVVPPKEVQIRRSESSKTELGPLKIEKRFVSTEYRMSISVLYRLANTSTAPLTYKLQEIAIEPPNDCVLCLSDETGFCLRNKTIRLNSNSAGVIESETLRLAHSGPGSGGQCIVDNLNLYIDGRNYRNSIALAPVTSTDAPRVVSALKIAIADSLTRYIPRCRNVHGIIQVFFKVGKSEKTKILEIPISVKLLSTVVSGDEFILRYPGTDTLNNLSLAWSGSNLVIAQHFFTAKDRLLQEKGSIEEIVINLGDETLWTGGPFSFSQLPVRIDKTLSEGLSNKIISRLNEIHDAKVSIKYRSQCHPKSQDLMLKVPVEIQESECQESLLSIVANAESTESLKTIQLYRDQQNRLVIPQLYIVSSGSGTSPWMIDRVDSVKLTIGQLGEELEQVESDQAQIALSETVLDSEHVNDIEVGSHEGRLTIKYYCVGSSKPNQTVQDVAVIAPGIATPSFILGRKSGKPLDDHKVMSFLGKVGVDDLVLSLKDNENLQDLGATIESIHVGPAQGGEAWKSWGSISSLPFNLDFTVPKLEFKDAGQEGKINGKIEVVYKLPGQSTPFVFSETFAEEVSFEIGWLIFIPIILIIIGFLIWLLFRGRKPIDFVLDITKEGRTVTTDQYSLRNGERLYLFPVEDQIYCLELNCLDYFIENRKGLLLLVIPDEEPEEISEETSYSLLDDGKKVELSIRFIESDEQEGEPYDELE